MYSVFYLFCFFILFLRSEISCAGMDSQYTSCSVPQTCGGLTIKYPFYIPSLQASYCGSPGFELECPYCSEFGCPYSKQPYFQLSGFDYDIHSIDYQNQTLFVSSKALSVDSSCLPLLSFTIQEEQFRVASNQTKFYLLYNCRADAAHESFSEYIIGFVCEYNYVVDKINNATLAVPNDDPQLGNMIKKCGNGLAMVPGVYEDDGNKTAGITDRVKRGFRLNWLEGNCSGCVNSGGICGSYINSFICFCQNGPHPFRCTDYVAGHDQKFRLKLGLVFAATFVWAMLIIFGWLFWEKRHQTRQTVESFLRTYGPLQVERYSYLDVKNMTNSLNEKLGQGGYGGVYKGKLKDGRIVAVKVLNRSKGNGEEFMNEVATISRTSHVNIVSLLGFCFEDSKRALIYEFMPNGSLEKFIFDAYTPPVSDHHLGWETLDEIALGIARGLEYLHRGCNSRILHFDIKPHNILLNEDFSPKISDFGLAKICTGKESVVSMMGARGTAGYIAPEVFCRNFGGVSHKSDVYSYGMMLSEMVGGRKNIRVEVEDTSEIYFPHWVHKRLELDQELGLHSIMNGEDKVRARKMIIVSLWCIQTDPSNRPSMKQVIEMLEGSVDSLEIPPKPYLSSPPPKSLP